MSRADEMIQIQGEDITYTISTAGADTGYGEHTYTQGTGATLRALIQALATSTGSVLSDLGTGKPSEPGFLALFKTSITAPPKAHDQIDSPTWGLLELTEPIQAVKIRGSLSHYEAHASKVPEA